MKAKKIALVVAGLILLVACSAIAGTITHEYDELNRLIRTTHPDGTIIEYTYDEAGNRLTVIKGNPSAQVPTVQISANPASIQAGESATLSWTSTNATSCSIDQGIGTVNTSGSTTVSPSVTTTYTITATGTGGTATSSATVTVTAVAPPPTVAITANPTAILEGGTATLTWTSTNATSCTIDQGIGAVDPNGGTIPVSPTVTTSYTITANGTGGTATSSVTITVTPITPPPTVSISANPTSIPYGGSTTLTWTSTNANACDIQPDVGTVGASGSISVSPTVTTTYTITATGTGGTATKSVTVTVASAPAPTVTISANPATIVVGASSTLTWTSTNADACDIQPDVGTVGLSGSLSVSPSVTTTYTITAAGAGGTATSSVTVTVAAVPPAPTVTISADPTTIVSGASSTLTWSSTNATSCSIDQGIGTVNTSGSTQVSPTATTTYTITATGPGGTATSSVTVTITTGGGQLRVTVQKAPGQPLAGIPVYLFNAVGYTYLSQTTDSAGVAVFAVPAAGTYKVRADYMINQFWSDEAQVTGDTAITLTIPQYHYQVTVQKAPGEPMAGVGVYLDIAGWGWSYLSQITNDSGVVVFEVPAGTYSVRAGYMAKTFSSEETHVTGDTAIVLTIPHYHYQVTVQKAPRQPLAGVGVYLDIAGWGWSYLAQTTNDAGVVVFEVPTGAYSVRAAYMYNQFQSEETQLTGDTAIVLTILHQQVEVTVTTGSEPVQGAPVSLFTESGDSLYLQQITDAAGKVSFDLPVGKNYKFRADVTGNQYWSNVITVTGGVNTVTITTGG